MATNFVQEGGVLNWTNGTGSDVSSGDVVVMGSTSDATICVALVDIANGASGAVAIEGVFTLPKVSAAVFKQGESLAYDVSASAFDDNQITAATGDVTGAVIAAADGAASETTCKVRLTGQAGTIN